MDIAFRIDCQELQKIMDCGCYKITGKTPLSYNGFRNQYKKSINMKSLVTIHLNVTVKPYVTPSECNDLLRYYL